MPRWPGGPRLQGRPSPAHGTANPRTTPGSSSRGPSREPGEGTESRLGPRSPPRPSSPARTGVSGPRCPLWVPACASRGRSRASTWVRPAPAGARDPLSRAGRRGEDPATSTCLPLLFFCFFPIVCQRRSRPSPSTRSLTDPLSSADFGLRSAPCPSRCHLSHPALHRPAHWDRARIWCELRVRKRIAPPRRGDAGRGSSRAAPRVERLPSYPSVRREPERPLPTSVRGAPRSAGFQDSRTWRWTMRLTISRSALSLLGDAELGGGSQFKSRLWASLPPLTSVLCTQLHEVQ